MPHSHRSDTRPRDLPNPTPATSWLDSTRIGIRVGRLPPHILEALVAPGNAGAGAHHRHLILADNRCRCRDDRAVERAPTMASTPSWSIRRCTQVTPSSGSDLSSHVTSSTGRPRMPPASLSCFTRSSAPWSRALPAWAVGPVRGPKNPKTTGSASAAGPAASVAAVVVAGTVVSVACVVVVSPFAAASAC